MLLTPRVLILAAAKAVHFDQQLSLLQQMVAVLVVEAAMCRHLCFKRDMTVSCWPAVAMVTPAVSIWHSATG